MRNEVTIYHRREGDLVVGFPMDFAAKVYTGCPIFQHRGFPEFFYTTSRTIRETPRWEYVVKNEDGIVVASMAVYKDFDMHVGECLSVLVAFSTEPYSLFKAYRWLVRLAKEEMVPFIAYTRKTGDYTMDLVYKKV